MHTVNRSSSKARREHWSTRVCEAGYLSQFCWDGFPHLPNCTSPRKPHLLPYTIHTINHDPAGMAQWTQALMSSSHGFVNSYVPVSPYSLLSTSSCIVLPFICAFHHLVTAHVLLTFQSRASRYFHTKHLGYQLPREACCSICSNLLIMSLSSLFHSTKLFQFASLQSLTLSNPSVAFDSENNIIHKRRTRNEASRKPSIISGCSSHQGHSLASLVGDGLLSAAVIAKVGSECPTVEQIVFAIENCVDTSSGVLIIAPTFAHENEVSIKDAIMKVTEERGVDVAMFVVRDALGNSTPDDDEVEDCETKSLAGILLVLKITGALAARGASLSDVYKVGKLVASNLVSIGASIETKHSSSQDEKAYLKIHPVHRDQPDPTILFTQQIRKLLSHLLPPSPSMRPFHFNTNEPILLLTSTGHLTPADLGTILTLVLQNLHRHHNIHPVRIYTSTFPTESQEHSTGSGFSVALLNVVNTDIGGPGMVQLLDQECEATGWNAAVKKETWESWQLVRFENIVEGEEDEEETIEAKRNGEEDAREGPENVKEREVVEEHESVDEKVEQARSLLQDSSTLGGGQEHQLRLPHDQKHDREYDDNDDEDDDEDEDDEPLTPGEEEEAFEII